MPNRFTARRSAAGVEIQGLALRHQDRRLSPRAGCSSGYTVSEIVQPLPRRFHSMKTAANRKRASRPALAFGTDDKRRVAREAVAIRAVAPVLEEQLRAQGIWELATTLEFPLIEVLARMEHTGILVDRGYLEKLNADFGAKDEDAWSEPFRSSRGRVQRELATPAAAHSLRKTWHCRKRKIKTGYSTDAAELEKLAGAHPIIDSLLEYREVSKLKNGFTEMLLALIDPKTSRIHTTYEQTTAATGRLVVDGAQSAKHSDSRRAGAPDPARFRRAARSCAPLRGLFADRAAGARASLTGRDFSPGVRAGPRLSRDHRRQSLRCRRWAT